MQENQLSTGDLKLIIESLKYTRLKFEEYDKYPDHEYKQKRISEVNTTLSKIEDILKNKKA